MSKPVCLIVEDEDDIRQLWVMTLEPLNIECREAATLSAAKDILSKEIIDLCFTDIRLPDGNGLDLVELVAKQYAPRTTIAVVTGYGDVEAAVTAFKRGAFDFLTKPVDLQQFRNLVANALSSQKPHLLPHLFEDREQFLQTRLLGETEAMKNLRAQIGKLAHTQSPVYIHGESGTGKEIIARMIHALSPRADRPFVPVNCGAIASELMESEFFGHVKGSFTGAHVDKGGLFQAAQGGTLFLDEIGDLPLSMQVKLLRAIQERQVRPVGSQKEIPVDVRILSATNRDLARLVEEKKFREDLFFRINVIKLRSPPLRERVEDIPLLSKKILDGYAQKMRAAFDPGYLCPTMSAESIDSLKKHDFPGNVRELENILERAAALCDNLKIEAKDLYLLDKDSPILLNSKALERVKPTKGGLDPLLGALEEEAILEALKKAKGNRVQAAKLLGIQPGALRYRIKKLFHGNSNALPKLLENVQTLPTNRESCPDSEDCGVKEDSGGEQEFCAEIESCVENGSISSIKE